KINGYKGLALETAIDNPAQKLYEKLDWEKDSHCFHYFWQVK
ncbi:MAG TPA: GNAT family N-acetyltransferase, partial [Maribacter sp.]|nr:GNAT family N-acetyltransferase [Maribacter sp.]